MENLSTLMGKYGEEGDKLLFKILNSGDWKSAISHEALDTATIGALTTKVSEKGLRYDLTVPFARFVVQHRDEIQFPFKRYQIQPVWRADRPQKGRYREFYQCDVDVVGTNSLLSEVELMQIVAEVYRRLDIRVSLHINNRKILAGIAEVIGQPERIIDITVAIDKLDKIGIDNVNKELLDKGLPTEAVEALQPILNLSGTNNEKLDQLAQVLAGSETGLKGIEELRTIFALYGHSTQDGDLNTYDPAPLQVELDLCLARGLNYYTGAIFEVKALDVQIGSITGGGRYDNLTGIFGMPGVSGVGISFGADRIYDVLSELNLYPENLQSTTQLLFATFGQEELLYAVKWASALRAKGYSIEVFQEPTKMKKQMGYADAKKIPFVAIVGSDEMEQNKVMLKNMTTGEQQLVSLDEIISFL
jgi:histidyl-tRNA synthetase